MRFFPAMFLAISILLTGSCSVVESPMPGPLAFTKYQPIYIDVGSVEFIEEYKSPMRPPYIEHLMPYSPTEAMRIWVKDRIRSVGNERSMQVIIKDGRVVANKAAESSGMMGFFHLAQDTKYDLTLNVEMRIYGRDSAMSEASINVSATRSITLSDALPSHERDVQFRKMVGDAMDTINAELEKNMYQYFGNYINYSHNP